MLAKSEPPTPPPTMASGNGCLSEGDWKKTPFQVMNEHEARIREYVKTLDRKAVVHHLKVAARHPYFEKYISQCSPSRRFGEKGIDDVVEYDMWLKKLEIAEKRSGMKTEPPKNSVPASPPSEPSKTAEPVDDHEKQTPAQKEAYTDFWSKFKAPKDKVQRFDSPATPTAGTLPTATPSPALTPANPLLSPQGSTTVTPECKKRLELEGGRSLLGSGLTFES